MHLKNCQYQKSLTNSLQSCRKLVKIAKEIRHEDYNSDTLANDIAIFKLEEDVSKQISLIDFG